jgi:Flp pilus assembly protein TadG
VTAEFAVGLPAIVAVLAIALSAVAAATAQLRCVDAARAGARAAARGESPTATMAAAKGAAPSGATVNVVRSGATVRVHVQGRVSLLGPIGAGRLSVAVSATEQAPVEGGAPAASG